MKGKSAAARPVPPPAAPKIPRVEKTERSMNSWLTAVGLSGAHPSAQLQLATSLQRTSQGSCPRRAEPGPAALRCQVNPPTRSQKFDSSEVKMMLL